MDPTAILIAQIVQEMSALAPSIEIDNQTNMGEGWGVFNLTSTTPNGPDLILEEALSVGIERVDDMGRFAGDDYVILHLVGRAARGDLRAARALAVNTLADRLRVLKWGAAWVDSRMGPPA
ncbi:hypothetical protein GURKE_05000 [Brevundimonas phage vB_BpoS-Gurke]|uniref:Uncharacterized protein n=1 Tax=Brevundimonas phage vB_BpoS-Gurke TaxID=2948599 RepID=A0A9E7N4S1_9CAUD|nr:hypothetical protein GURKE_05000 [Brevundimonas phage vB_BpoS-Gurke]